MLTLYGSCGEGRWILSILPVGRKIDSFTRQSCIDLCDFRCLLLIGKRSIFKMKSCICRVRTKPRASSSEIFWMTFQLSLPLLDREVNTCLPEAKDAVLENISRRDKNLYYRHKRQHFPNIVRIFSPQEALLEPYTRKK